MSEKPVSRFRLASRYVAVGMIRVYQKTISFDHGLLRAFYPNGYCRFTPSCSEYAAQAIDKKGLWRGSLLILRRLSRCHPWSAGGHDPVI